MNDGVPSITQCPIAPGDSMTYTWVAENYGTSWYHSHFAIQAWEGVLGPVVINGPSSASYDVDAGVIQLQDWSHFTVDSRYDLAENATLIPNRTDGATFGGPVTMDTGLINGLNVWNGDNQNSTPIGERYQLTFEPGKSYLLRVINSAIQSTYKFYLDGHTFTVISADFVPIVPYTTDILNINIGQRYNVIVTANQPSGSYWLRADNQNACAGTIQANDIRAVVTYSDAVTGVLPTSVGYNYTEECVDEPYASLVPVVALDSAAANFTEGTLEVVIQGNAASLYKWYLSGTTFFSQYNDPTLLDIYTNNTVPSYSGNLLVELPDAKEMVYVIIESPIPLPHPIHLHGHDFWILAEGAGSFDSTVLLNLANPPRRDTALLPAAGYLVLAFETDNPGVWLMHCHIGWHTS
jgi:FtsP/CotA-like multicopper oxidase with cupredoxin domain